MTTTINPATLGRLASTLTPQPVSWLWQDRIPIGHLTLLEGQPGSSKSLLTLHLAACVSNTLPMPNSTSCCPQGGVILITPNDNDSAILTPRLIAACGDPHHLLFLTTVPQDDPSAPQRPLSLPEDLDALEAAITYRHATLVIIHPLASILSKSAAARRHLYTQLAALARRTHCAILLVRSTAGSKATSYQLNTGPLDLLDAVDSRLLLIRDPEDSEQHLLICTKHSLCPQPTTLAYQITPNDQGLPTLTWLGDNDHPKGLFPDIALPSMHRRIILNLLREDKKPLGPTFLAKQTGQSYEAAAKMLQRMRKSNQIVCVGHGLYTTPTHPCLATFNILLGNDDDVTSTFTPISNAQITSYHERPIPPVPTISIPGHEKPPVQLVQTVPIPGHEHPPVQPVQSVPMPEHEHPPVQNVQTAPSQPPVVYDTSEETARAREAILALTYGPDGTHRHPPTDHPHAFSMPGNNPSELEPYVPIWEKATTPPPPPHNPKEEDESENRYPSLRIEPPGLLYPGEGPY